VEGWRATSPAENCSALDGLERERHSDALDRCDGGAKQWRRRHKEQTGMCNGLAEGAVQWAAVVWRTTTHRITGQDFYDYRSVRMLRPVVDMGLGEEGLQRESKRDQ
jgi:hypothetical protein